MRTHILNKDEDGKYSVTFIDENGNDLGTISYADKSIYYANSAIDNWYAGVLTEETIERYKID